MLSEAWERNLILQIKRGVAPIEQFPTHEVAVSSLEYKGCIHVCIHWPGNWYLVLKFKNLQAWRLLVVIRKRECTLIGLQLFNIWGFGNEC